MRGGGGTSFQHRAESLKARGEARDGPSKVGIAELESRSEETPQLATGTFFSRPSRTGFPDVVRGPPAREAVPPSSAQ